MRSAGRKFPYLRAARDPLTGVAWARAGEAAKKGAKRPLATSQCHRARGRSKAGCSQCDSV